MRKGNLKKLILEYLSKSSVGATITDIARDLGVSRPTVYRYLSELKAQKLVKEINIGAYRLYIAQDKFASEVKMISRKLLCSLANSLFRLFKNNTLNISFSLGRTLVDSFFELYPEETDKLRLVDNASPFTKLEFVLKLFLGREVKLNIIELEKRRCVLIMRGTICEINETKIILSFLKGAMQRFIEVLTGNYTITFSLENIKISKTEEYAITLEMILTQNANQ